MERLTMPRNADGTVSQPTDMNWYAVLDKLTSYEDAEEQGRLVVLPCKVGGTVWVITKVFCGFGVVEKLESRQIDEIRYGKLNGGTMVSLTPYERHFYPSGIGNAVFLTRKEAEAALRKEQA